MPRAGACVWARAPAWFALTPTTQDELYYLTTNNLFEPVMVRVSVSVRARAARFGLG